MEHRARALSLIGYRLAPLHRGVLAGPFLVGAVLFAAVCRGDQQSDPLRYDPDPEKQWKESAVSLPPYPRERALHAVPVPPLESFRLYLDGSSLERGADGVIRFVLVVESSSGARNVFYEGIRCETRQYKTYAVGTPEGRWRPLKEPKWQTIPNYGTSVFRHYLYKLYVCDSHSSARAPRDVMRELHAAGPHE